MDAADSLKFDHLVEAAEIMEGMDPLGTDIIPTRRVGGPSVSRVSYSVARTYRAPTRRERQFAHKAKMVGRVYDRNRRMRTSTEGEDTLYCAVLRKRSRSIAQLNRHTGKPHEHARERMRREMTPMVRSAFAEAIRQGLDATAARRAAYDSLAAF